MRKRKATRSEIIERNRKIVKDYEDGLSFEQLSEKYGLCVRTCYRALDEEQQAQRIAEEYRYDIRLCEKKSVRALPR